MVAFTVSCLAMTLTGFSSGCSLPVAPTFTTDSGPATSALRSRSLEEPVPSVGLLPLPEALRLLQEGRVLERWPTPPSDASSIPTGSFLRYADVVEFVEIVTGWVYDREQRAFYVSTATHSVDGPDAFGRPSPGTGRASLQPRAMVAVAFRFRRVSAGISDSSINAGVVLSSFRASVPEGVPSAFVSAQERGYFRGVRSPVADSPDLVETERVVVNGGLELSAIAARLPGGYARIDGQLSVSSFQGTTLDRNQTALPLQADFKRSAWIPLLRIRNADAGMELAFSRLGFDIGASGDDLVVDVRID